MGWWEDFTSGFVNPFENGGVFWVNGGQAGLDEQRQAEKKAKEAATGKSETTTQDLEQQLGNLKPPEIHYINDDPSQGIDYILDPNTGQRIDYSQITEDMNKARGALEGIGTYDEWLKQRGYSPLDLSGETQGIQALIDKLQAGNSPEDMQAAHDYTAKLLGLSPEEYDATLANLAGQVSQGISGQQGFTDQERAARERVNQTVVREAEIRARREIENIRANSGSATRAYMKADEAMRAINDTQLKAQVAMLDEERRRQEVEYNASNTRWMQMVEEGRMSQKDYLENLRANRVAALQGFATKADTLLKQNAQYLSEYNEDLNAVNTYVTGIYNGINAQLGVNQDMFNTINNLYQQDMAPILAQLDALYRQQELDSSTDNTAAILEMVGGAALLGLGVFTGNPALITGGIGLVTTGATNYA